MTQKKFFNYFFNILLGVIVLILIIPSWRISFQGWYQGIFMGDVEFRSNLALSIPEETQNWAIFDTKSKLINFSEFKGKTILLNFWATWCPPCRAELPELKEIYLEYQDKVHVVAVTEETIEKIENSGLHKDYDFLYSTPGVPAFFELRSYPTLLIIDKNMQIVFRNEGAGKMNTEKNKAFLDVLIQN